MLTSAFKTLSFWMFTLSAGIAFLDLAMLAGREVSFFHSASILMLSSAILLFWLGICALHIELLYIADHVRKKADEPAVIR